MAYTAGRLQVRPANWSLGQGRRHGAVYAGAAEPDSWPARGLGAPEVRWSAAEGGDGGGGDPVVDPLDESAGVVKQSVAPSVPVAVAVAQAGLAVAEGARR